MFKRLTTKEFIERAKKIHGDNYDYSLVNYVNKKSEITIICSTHGAFKQLPYVHLRGSNCPKCNNNNTKKITLDVFIERCNKIHNNFYDYSNIDNIKNTITKVKIICPIHGAFLQTPKNHFQGKGCPNCVKNKKYTHDDFCIKANETHNFKYIYPEKYINSHTKIKIICSKHGEFKQRPYEHIQGSGCPICAKNTRNKKNTLTTEKFIEKARKVHGDEYKYVSKYINSYTHIDIECKLHGIFSQTPHIHLKGSGCPLCKMTNPEKQIKKFFISKNITFNYQKIFKDCRDIRYLPFDFYLPEYNLCVEYDGEQHFKSIKYWGDEDGLKKRQKHDQIKTQYCNDNNIELLRIRYDEKIEEKLNNYFN